MISLSFFVTSSSGSGNFLFIWLESNRDAAYIYESDVNEEEEW